MVSTQKVFEIPIGRIEQLENKALYGRLLRIEKYIHSFVVGHTQLLDSKLDRPNREKEQNANYWYLFLSVEPRNHPKKFFSYGHFFPIQKSSVV